MLPVVLAPPFIAAPRAKRGPRQAKSGKLLSVPQSVLLWSYNDERNKKNHERSILGSIQLVRCRQMSIVETNLQTVHFQTRAWQDMNAYTRLDGKYVIWDIANHDKCVAPVPLPDIFFRRWESELCEQNDC